MSADEAQLIEPRPVIHVTNWSSRKLHGPGLKWTIMVSPREWEHGYGKLNALVPLRSHVSAARSGRLSMDEFKIRFMKMVAKEDLSPGKLMGHIRSRPPVRDGDTICCSCSKAEASKGNCHRVWAAQALLEAGWRVVLDGVDLTQPAEAIQGELV